MLETTLRRAATTLAVAAAAALAAAPGFADHAAAPAASPEPAARLEESPRHHEWVAVEAGDRTVHTYVAYPQTSERVPAVVVIHENRGLNDWARSVADQLAEKGYVALAPDLLSGAAPGGGKTSDFPSADAAREAIGKLTPAQVMADLDAVADYAAKIPAASGKVAVAGFCWGGAQTFRFANHRKELAAAFPFYGTGPDSPEGVAGITAPVYGFYGGNDARVNATIPKTEELMKAAGKPYEPVVYEGAGHGFMRSGEASDASEADRQAREKAWERWLKLLAAL